MGLTFGVLDFAGFSPLPYPVDDDIIRNIRTNTGLRISLLDRNDLRNSQPFRLNPYGLRSGGWNTEGFEVGGASLWERRLTGRWPGPVLRGPARFDCGKL